MADEASVARAVATALELREAAGQPPADMLRRFLADRELLLLLDNCEHLLSACATLASGLLHAAPGLRVLATSRQPLGLTGERAWRVPSLSVPERPGGGASEAPCVSRTSARSGPRPERLGGGAPEAPDALLEWPATRLFLERALEASSSFTVTVQNARFVAEICRRLEGIPLAIELAAARVKALTVEQIAARLEDAFRLLTGGDRSALPRHQTLRGRWTGAMRCSRSRSSGCCASFSVFAGGWTLEAAEAVSGWGPGIEEGSGVGGRGPERGERGGQRAPGVGRQVEIDEARADLLAASGGNDVLGLLEWLVESRWSPCGRGPVERGVTACWRRSGSMRGIIFRRAARRRSSRPAMPPIFSVSLKRRRSILPGRSRRIGWTGWKRITTTSGRPSDVIWTMRFL